MEFWESQLVTAVPCDLDKAWVDEERQKCEMYEQMQKELFTTQEMTNIVKCLHNWKAPGSDYYWIFLILVIAPTTNPVNKQSAMNPRKHALISFTGNNQPDS